MLANTATTPPPAAAATGINSGVGQRVSVTGRPDLAAAATQPGSGPALSPLGINTKLHSTLPGGANNTNFRTANRARRIIEQLEQAQGLVDYRLIRFVLLAFLRLALPGATGEFMTKTGKVKMEFRTKNCMAFVRQDKGLATFQYSDQSGKAGLHDVGVCGSVWVCPVCSERITAERRRELKHLLAVQDKYFIVMVTYTLSHHEGEQLKPMVDSLNKAFMNTKQGGAWARLAKRWGIVGDVTALEVTHGVNGWHPHKHQMLVIDREKIGLDGPKAKELFESELRAELYAIYHHKLNLAGRDCDEEHGLLVTANRKDYGDYITKWGVTEELTRSVHKLASGGGRSVWELLEGAARGNQRDWNLFLEYARAFKGKKQLHWSKGLRELLELGAEKSDQEAAEVIDLPEDRRVVVAVSQMGLTYINSKELTGPIILFIERTRGDVDQVLAYLARMGLTKFVTGGPPQNTPPGPPGSP